MERTKHREVQAPELIGESPAWIEVRGQLARVAASGLPVLLLGETGTGKELVARAIHAFSPRRTHGFVAHNCGATPDTLIESELFGHSRGAFTGAVADREGLFEAADGGTIFLDEIGDASPLLQMKLLRVLQEGEARRVGDTRLRRIDVRVVSATHRPLDEHVTASGFRADLYYRLNAVVLRLPPLRERRARRAAARARSSRARRQRRATRAVARRRARGARAALSLARQRSRARERVRRRGARRGRARRRDARTLAAAEPRGRRGRTRAPRRDARARGAPADGGAASFARKQVGRGARARTLAAGIAQEAPSLRARMRRRRGREP